MTDKEELPVRNALIVAALAGIPLMILLVALQAPKIVIWVPFLFSAVMLVVAEILHRRAEDRRKEQARL
jgi:hypothetical protein